MKVAQKRPLIAFMQDSFQVSERRACCVLPLIRSSCRRTSTRKDPVVLRQRIRELAESRVRYGYRRIHILLQREGFKVGKDRVHRLYRQEGLSLRRKRPRRHTSAARRVERPEPQQKNRSWSMNFVSAEFISKALDLWAYQAGVTLDFSRPRKPTDNASIESFNRSFRDECWNVNWFLSTKDARTKVEAWRQEYNEFRPHRSLWGKTPEPFLGSGDWVPRIPT